MKWYQIKSIFSAKNILIIPRGVWHTIANFWRILHGKNYLPRTDKNISPGLISPHEILPLIVSGYLHIPREMALTWGQVLSVYKFI